MAKKKLYQVIETNQAPPPLVVPHGPIMHTYVCPHCGHRWRQVQGDDWEWCFLCAEQVPRAKQDEDPV